MLQILVAVLAILGVARSGRIIERGARAGGPSNDPIATDVPNLPAGRVAVDAPPGPFFQGLNPPYPTDSWWAGYAVGNQDATAAGPFPFQTSTSNAGLVFGVSGEADRNFDGTSIHQNTLLELQAGFVGLPETVDNRKAIAWDTQTISLQYFGGASTLDTSLVPGSPYITLEYTNAAVTLTSLVGDAITSFDFVTPGQKAKIVLTTGTYILYVIDGALTLTLAGKVLTSPAGFTGTIRLAKLEDPAQEAILDAHSGTYPIGLTHSFNVLGDIGTQTWVWDVVGDPNNLLILSFPHHRKILQGANYENIQYIATKGYMKGVTGNTWNLRYTLPTIYWFPDADPNPSCIPELAKTLEIEINSLQELVPGDFYFWGGSYARAAQLATIAEHIGRDDLIDKVVDILKASVAYWFDPAHRPGAAYETGWGGFVNSEGWNNTWVDFGNTYYNDHHFHYGYFLHGSSVIGRYDPAWLAEHKEFLTHIARDIGNPSPNDPHYTVTRHLDFFAGHSWASGIANGAGPRDQESTGEAINAYYGLLLFANVTDNQALSDYSRLLLAIEVLGAQTYWHLYPNADDPDSPYPEQGLRDLVTIGNVMDTQAGAWLFWGGEKIQITAIQILPVTPIGHYTFDAAWAGQLVDYCRNELDDTTLGDDFKSVIYAAHARVNPQSAFSFSENLFDWGSGNSASNQLYFVATEPSATDICSAGASTPEGIFVIQELGSGNFVEATADGTLAVAATADILATKFRLEFRPGGSTIYDLTHGKYVTASPDGSGPLNAARDTAESYEIFRWAEQPDGSYQLTAMVNRATVSAAGANAQLVNNGVATNFRLVQSNEDNPAPIPAQGTLSNVQTGAFVVATQADPILRAIGNSAAEATVWSFERVPDSTDASPLYTIRSQTTNELVTAGVDGTQPLSALRDEGQAWEYFQIIVDGPNFAILHSATGLAVAVQGDNTLIDNNANLDNTALWNIG